MYTWWYLELEGIKKEDEWKMLKDLGLDYLEKNRKCDWTTLKFSGSINKH